MNESDAIRLKHMLSYANEAVEFSKNETRESLDNDVKLVRALSMSIGVIGEAASHISRAFQDNHPEIPWPDIIGMRNFLFHAYFKVDNDILWNTATRAVPDLIVELEKLIPSEDDKTNET